MIIHGTLSSPKALANSIYVNCWPQGATITKNYFLYADWCGNESQSFIIRCNRNGTSISNCKSIAQGYFRHANVLDGKWGSNYYWVLDSGVARKQGHKHWCLDVRSGQQVDASNCGDLPSYKVESGISSTNQGMAQYGRFYLRGYSGNNRIDLYEHDNRINRFWVGHDWEELEDIAVDGDTGEIYFTTGYNNGSRMINLYRYDGYRMLPFSQLDKTVTFNLNGLLANLDYSEKKVEYGKSITPPKLTVKNDYQLFKYWSAEPNGSEFDFNTAIKKDTILYAIFEYRKYNVSFDLNGLTAGTIESQSIAWGETAKRPDILINDDKEYLKYWSTKKNGDAFDFNTPIKKDTKLYAVYGNRCDDMTDSARRIVCPDYNPSGSAGGNNAGENNGDFISVIHAILNSIISICGVVAVIYITIGGVNYMTSTGDSAKVEKAKKMIIYAVIGLVVCALAFAITNWVISIL